MGLTLEEKQERVRDLRPIDDVFFEVVANDRSVCEEILRTILEDEKLTVQDVIVQSSERNLYGHSVRLDALCILGTGELVNIEVQRSDNDDHLKRVRFNAASITLRGSQAGDDYSNLPRVIIVYISEFDIFRKNRTIYHVEKILRETGTVIDDGLTEIFVNAAVHDGTAIDELMRCFLQKRIDSERFPKLSKRVEELKSTEGGMTAVCDVMKRYEDIAKAQGRAEGMAEGITKGMAEGITKGMAEGITKGMAEGITKGMAEEKVSIARKLIATGILPDEQISEATGLTVKEIEAIRNGSAA